MSETKALASYITASQTEHVPADVRHEACRAILNYVGCAVGGSHEPPVETLVRALAPFSGSPTAKVLGRAEQYDPLLAALVNGISSHVFEYDDTTPKNYIHPSPPVASALFAYSAANARRQLPALPRRLRLACRSRGGLRTDAAQRRG
jgi:2-methylcitrate dehydratase PrpD